MPPTRWKQEEEEGKANHRQTLNSLTPSRLQTAPLAFPSGTAGLLLPFPCFWKQPSFSIPHWKSITPKEEPLFPLDRRMLCPEHLPQAPPEHACPPPPRLPLLRDQAPVKLPYTAHLRGHRRWKPPQTPEGHGWSQRHPSRGASSKEKHPVPAHRRALS